MRAATILFAVGLAGLLGAAAVVAAGRGGGGPPPAAASPDLRIDLNTASGPDLALLPGIGPGVAERIIAWRTDHGPLRGAADLDAVAGIGPRTLEQVEDFVCFGAPAAGRP